MQSKQTTLKSGLALVLFAAFCGLSFYFLNPFQGIFGERELAQMPQITPPSWSNLESGLALQPVPLENGSNGSGGLGGNTAVGQTRPLEQLTVRFQGQTNTVRTGDLYASKVAQTTTDTGAPAYIVEYDETGANALVTQLWQQYATAELESSVRNPGVDLQNGALVLQAEAETPLGWQDVAVTLDFNEQGTAFEVGQINIGGFAFSSPPGALADMVAELEREGNNVLQSAVIVDPAGQLTIGQIYIADNMLRIIAN